MSTTTNLEMTYIETSQSGKNLVINEDLDILDLALGAGYGQTVQTGTTYTVLKTDFTVFLQHTAAHTITLPATTGAAAPRAGQKFVIKDASASGAGTYAVTIAVPSGKKLDGVTNGTLVISADRGWAEVVFISDAIGYLVSRAKGILQANDLLLPWSSTVGLDFNAVNSTVIPASDATPSYLPFVFDSDISVDAMVFPFGTVSPTPDIANANIRLAFYESLTTFLPGAIRFASEDFLLQGSGHIRTTPLGYGNVGSVLTSVAICVLSARRYFKANTLYFIGLHYQATFAGSPTTIDGGRGAGFNPVKLAAGAQAWPYTFTASPSVGAMFSADDELRANLLFRYRKIADVY